MPKNTLFNESSSGSKFFNSDGSVKQIHELDDDTAMALAGMNVCEVFEGSSDQKHAYGS